MTLCYDVQRQEDFVAGRSGCWILVIISDAKLSVTADVNLTADFVL